MHLLTAKYHLEADGFDCSIEDTENCFELSACKDGFCETFQADVVSMSSTSLVDFDDSKRLVAYANKSIHLLKKYA